MLDLTAEETLTLAELVKMVPPARSGKRCHLSTVLRWILKGSKAPDGSMVKLEAARLGGRWLTSREALHRFSERLTPRLDGEAQPAPSGPAKQHRASDRAAAELDKLGL